METITIHEAKTNLSRLIEKACRGEEVVIARGSEPVVRLVALKDSKGHRQPGSLGSNAVVVSAASAWEIATKVRLGKLDIAAELTADFSNILAQEGFESLPI